MSEIKNSILIAVGKTISNERKKKSISQEQLAELSETHRTYISEIENGKRNPTITVLWKILMALDSNPTTFFAEVMDKI